MAQQYIFTCPACGFTVETWDDGNPYIEGPDGKRHHFYHPCERAQIKEIVSTILDREASQAEIDQMLREHCGNESDHICLACGAEERRNDKETRRPCKRCGAKGMTHVSLLQGKRCPTCKQAVFPAPEPGAIS